MVPVGAILSHMATLLTDKGFWHLTRNVAAAFALTCLVAGPVRANEIAPPRILPAHFTSSDGTELAGDLYVPTHRNATAAFVLVHGSGPAPRMKALAHLLSRSGFAVLTYDKRGVGQSGGLYEETDNVSAQNLNRLADDAVAAFTWLGTNASARDVPAGFVGLSQAGWIVPLALRRVSHVAFFALPSGPVCTTSEQLHYQRFMAAQENRVDAVTNSDITEAMRGVAYRPDDVDPRASLTGLTIPGLWLYGDRDPYVPVALSIARLDELTVRVKSPFKHQVFPGEGHNLLDSPTQPSWQYMVQWIHDTTRKPAAR